jgi:hypothetical protein
MKSIFPGAIDGDLLKLVHLSNSFRTVEGAKPLQVGDICRPEARIAGPAVGMLKSNRKIEEWKNSFIPCNRGQNNPNLEWLLV